MADRPGDIRRRVEKELRSQTDDPAPTPPDLVVRVMSRTLSGGEGLYLYVRPFPRLYDENENVWPSRRMALGHGDIGLAWKQADKVRAVLLDQALPDEDKVRAVYRIATQQIPHFICSKCGWTVRLGVRGQRPAPPSWTKMARCKKHTPEKPRRRPHQPVIPDTRHEYRTEEEAEADPFFEGKIED